MYALHTEKSLWDLFKIEDNMIVVLVFLLIMNLIEFRMAYNQKEIFRYDHIAFNLIGMGRRSEHGFKSRIESRT